MTEMTNGEVTRTLERIEVKVDKVTDDHETRLRRAERWIYALPPTFLIAVAGAIAAVLRGGG